MSHQQLQIRHLELAPPPRTHDFSAGRRLAALALVRGYEEAISQLDQADVEELAVYRAELRDARLCAGLAPIAFAASQPGADAQLPA